MLLIEVTGIKTKKKKKKAKKSAAEKENPNKNSNKLTNHKKMVLFFLGI